MTLGLWFLLGRNQGKKIKFITDLIKTYQFSDISRGNIIARMFQKQDILLLLTLIIQYQKMSGDFPGSPAVKTLPSISGHAVLIPGWGAKILHAS